MPPSPIQQFAIDAGALMDALRFGLVQQLLAGWFSLAGHNRKDVPTFVNFAVPSVLGGQKVVVELAHSYVAGQWGAAGMAAPALPTDRVATGLALRGVDPAVVYARPFVDVWSGLKNGVDLATAVDHGAVRIQELVHTDLQLAHDHAVRDMYSRATPRVGYRRVLVGATNCALCIIASTQHYRRGDLMPIHPHCNCKTEPAVGRFSGVLDAELVRSVHAEIAAKYGISDKAARRLDYRKVLLTRDHGEYGPTLTYSKDLFTGPDHLNRPAVKTPPRRGRPPGGKAL